MNRLAALIFMLFAAHGHAQVVNTAVPAGPGDYPQWRGANRDGISSDTGLLKQWPEEGPPVAWTIDHVGVGYSSVAIKDGIIVTMGDLSGVEHVIALKAEDGSRLWAVQPEPVAQSLSEKVDQEFATIDRNSDGVIDETEALAKFGLDFLKVDRGSSTMSAEQRSERLFSALDENEDGVLSFEEAGKQLGDQFLRMDTAVETATPAATALMTERRAEELIRQADKNSDGEVTQSEANGTYLGAVFRRADRRNPSSRRGDQKLTRDEVLDYLGQREAGKDGLLSSVEFLSEYASRAAEGDGILTREELRGLYGGYRNNQGDGPRGTPTIDENRVYAEGGNGDVCCLDLTTGRTLWKVSLIDDLGGSRPTWGFSESPLVINQWVIVTPGGSRGTVAALDKFTGDVIWQSEENTEAAHYSSPIFTTIGGIAQIVQFARESAFGLALEDGKLLWKYSAANNSTANCCTPIVDQDHVFVASAYGTGGGLAKVSTEGKVQTADEVYFERKMAIHHGGIVKIGEYMYSCGGGTLICMNFLTGEIAWQDRSVGKGSITAADGMLYVQSERQELALVEATPEEYRERGRISWESHGRPSWAHPVVAGGKLYVRDQQQLTAYDVSR